MGQGREGRAARGEGGAGFRHRRTFSRPHGGALARDRPTSFPRSAPECRLTRRARSRLFQQWACHSGGSAPAVGCVRRTAERKCGLCVQMPVIRSFFGVGRGHSAVKAVSGARGPVGRARSGRGVARRAGRAAGAQRDPWTRGRSFRCRSSARRIDAGLHEGPRVRAAGLVVSSPRHARRQRHDRPEAPPRSAGSRVRRALAARDGMRASPFRGRSIAPITPSCVVEFRGVPLYFSVMIWQSLGCRTSLVYGVTGSTANEPWLRGPA